MKEQKKLEKGLNTITKDFTKQLLHKNRKYYYIANPCPVYIEKEKRLAYEFYVYNRKTDQCTTGVYCYLTDIIKNDKKAIKKVKKELKIKIKQEKI